MAGLALAAGAAGVIVCAFVCDKDSGQKAEMKQKIVNKIDISAVADVLVKQGAVTSERTAIIQNVAVTFEEHCVPPEESLITQNANIDAKVYNVVTTKIDQKVLNKVRAAITNQLTAAAQQVDKKLLAFLEKNMDAETKQTVKNTFTNTIQANVTVDTISKVFTDNSIQQNVSVICDGPMPKDFTIDQDAQINLAVLNMINNNISQLAKNDTLLKIFNPLYAKATQEQTDFMSEFIDMLKQYGIMIAIGIILIIVVIIVLVIIVKMARGRKKGGPRAVAPAPVPVPVARAPIRQP